MLNTAYPNGWRPECQPVPVDFVGAFQLLTNSSGKEADLNVVSDLVAADRVLPAVGQVAVSGRNFFLCAAFPDTA